ncbi:molybdenum cofactor biosysynthesis protein [Curtobacterium flaccumfaciens]|nr:molybdenum cofactor biosysynthesis protein [Curtobacterium flaccumfaciens]
MTSVDDVAEPGDMPYRTDVEIAMLLVSRRHRYEGRPADGALPVLADDPDELREQIELRRGLGIVGDRYFASRAHVHASVTVIGLEALEAVGEELGKVVDPTATRRNVFLRGADVEALRGEPFSLSGPAGGPGRSCSAGTVPRTRVRGWTTRWRRGRSGRCGTGRGAVRPGVRRRARPRSGGAPHGPPSAAGGALSR